MSLKESIVIVNEFTTKMKDGRGTRGATPGNYVSEYMARNGATEDLTPVRLNDLDSFITRYMAREEATEVAESVPKLKKSFQKSQKYGGVAFGYGDVSLSDAKFRFASRDIQRNFDNGKTVMKTVLSFTEDYLKENGLVDKDFMLYRKGDYRGNLDQMKLRMAIMNGIKKMSRNYDDLQYIGVIQVDTKHVHCHLAMVDRGKGNLMADGAQRGMLNETAKRDLRRGIDMFLDEKQKVRMMTSNIGYDKRNAVCYIKKFTHKTMELQGIPQFLLACLPDDKRLWRASTNRKEMQKPNAIVREYVTQVLNEPDSGYEHAMSSVYQYAKERADHEGLSMKEYRTLVKNGQDRIMNDCINGVYSVLKQIPDTAKSVQTPMMSAMSLDYESMASSLNHDPMMEFGFKLRSYSSRLSHHKKEMHKYHELVENAKSMEDKSEDAQPLIQFFENEEDYNAKLMCKYQYFLSFLPPSDEFEDDFDELVAYERRMKQLNDMRNDKSMARMKPESAEDYGKKVYDMHGGRYVVVNPDILDMRYERMTETYAKMKDQFSFKLADYGLTLNEKGVSTKKPYEFDDVKALDLHHLGYDFYRDIEVSKINVDHFIDAANERSELLEEAVDYLEQSGQGDMVRLLPVTDIEVMQELADEMDINPVLPMSVPDEAKHHSARTVALGVNYEPDMRLAVKSTIASTVEMSDYDNS